jgi:CheY-like chemotaxis protein
MSDVSPNSITPEQIRQALLSLYSPTELAKSALARALPESRSVADLVQRAQVVRNILLDAAQTLRPANRVAPSTTAGRAHDCLMLRYVSGLSIGEVACELSLSSRQVYRDLHWAEERIAELLTSRLQVGPAPAACAPDVVSLEIGAVAHRPERLSLREVVRSALSAVQLIAQRRRVSLSYAEPDGDVFVSATPGILKQVVIQVLSAIVQSLSGSEVDIDLLRSDGAATLRLRFGQSERLERPDLLEAALRIADSQGFSCQFHRSTSTASLQISLPLATRQKVLIVEDSPGACALYERYLESTEFETLQIVDPSAALEVAQKEQAQVIVLDIMMPELDGWTLLQSLKLDPRTRLVPVVICSVIADLELAKTLGATGYLTKPVSRADFVTCLRQATAVSPSQGRR